MRNANKRDHYLTSFMMDVVESSKARALETSMHQKSSLFFLFFFLAFFFLI